MDKPAVKEKGCCWICFNNENNITLTTVDSERTLKSCETYLDISIIIKRFEKENRFSCCSCCFGSTRQLISLEEQVEKLQKEISEVSSLFSKHVLQRRSRLENEMDNSIKSVLPTEKCFKSPDYNVRQNHHSLEMIENVTVKEEVIETTSKELTADSKEGNIKSEDNTITSDPWFETSEIENVNTEECELGFNLEDAIEIKYSYDETVTRAVDSSDEEIVANQGVSETDAEEHQEAKTMSMADLLKSVKMPILRLERLQPCRNSPKIVAAAGKKELKGGKVSDENKCSVCGLGYLNILDLQHHVKSHEKKRPHTCSFCAKSFLKADKKNRHEKIHTGERPFNCSICSKSFITADHLRTHEKTHQEKKMFGCSFCSKSFRRADKLKTHEKCHTEEKLYKCSFCSKSFVLSWQLNQHAKHHSEDRPHKCSICAKSFLSPYALKLHERSHTGEKPFSCCLCSKSFISPNKLRRHKICHSEDKPYKCSSCAKSFFRSDSLRAHQKSHSEERPHQCSLCEKSFTKAAHLKRHESIHSGERPYKCSFSPKSFKQSKGDTILDETKSHECSICGLGYHNLLDLQDHVKFHAKERPHTCSFCAKSFLTADKRNRHEKIHTGERPFTCLICSKSFTRADNLRTHERCHSEDKPYKCSSCAKSFFRSDSLRAHQKSHSEGRPH